MNKKLAILFAFAAVGACGGSGEKSEESAETAAAVGAPPGAEQTPDAGRRLIMVKMTTEADGTNRYDPANLEAHQGDVIRFTLGMGVHNVNFLPDSNTVKSGLPPASPMLQLPGQTYDIKVSLPEGRYYFHCDPHAALGMKGYLQVED